MAGREQRPIILALECPNGPNSGRRRRREPPGYQATSTYSGSSSCPSFPDIVTVNAGEDIIESIRAYFEGCESVRSRYGALSLKGHILSAQGDISNPTVKGEGSDVSFEGTYAIATLSGFYDVPSVGPVQLNNLVLSFPGANHLISGGCTVGPLIAATNVQDIIQSIRAYFEGCESVWSGYGALSLKGNILSAQADISNPTVKGEGSDLSFEARYQQLANHLISGGHTVGPLLAATNVQDIIESIRAYFEGCESVRSGYGALSLKGHILSTQGDISNPAVKGEGSDVSFEGTYAIATLSGFYDVPYVGPIQLNNLVLSFPGANHLISGGRIVGPLIAVTNVQVVVHWLISREEN